MPYGKSLRMGSGGLAVSSTKSPVQLNHRMMTGKLGRVLKVTAGPSREELFDALRLCAEGRKVFFSYEDGHVKEKTLVAITAIECEDGSGQSFMFKFSGAVCSRGGSGEGHCNTRTREGWIKFLK